MVSQTLFLDGEYGKKFKKTGNKGVFMSSMTEIEKRVEKLENLVNNFMKKWGPDIQKKRDERDQIWDEMVRVIRIQDKNRLNKD